MSDLLLKDFNPKSALITKEHHIEKPKFPVFDAHVHFGRLTREGKYFDFHPDGGWVASDVPATVDLLDQLGVNWIANMDGGYGDLLKQNIERYKEAFPASLPSFAGWIGQPQPRMERNGPGRWKSRSRLEPRD